MASNIYVRSFILRGKNRKQILESLSTGRKTQAQIHKETGIYRTHVRRTLLELLDKKLVRCLNPKDRIGKWYAITSLGRSILRQVRK